MNPHDPATWTYGMTLMGTAREKNSRLEGSAQLTCTCILALSSCIAQLQISHLQWS